MQINMKNKILKHLWSLEKGWFQIAALEVLSRDFVYKLHNKMITIQRKILLQGDIYFLFLFFLLLSVSQLWSLLWS